MIDFFIVLVKTSVALILSAWVVTMLMTMGAVGANIFCRTLHHLYVGLRYERGRGYGKQL